MSYQKPPRRAKSQPADTSRRRAAIPAHARRPQWLGWLLGVAGAVIAVALVLIVMRSLTPPPQDTGVASVHPSNQAASVTSSPAQKGAVAFSACMRSHGVSDFPDPNSNGTIMLPQNADLSSPQFQAAQQACQALRPGGAGGPPSAADQQKAVQYAACMRQHGFPDYPDPQPTGSGFTVEIPSGFDPNSPQTQAALQACRAFNVLPGGGAP
jgi:hypothetical protein